IRRLGGALGGRLSPALEHHRLERSAALEGLYPAHPGRSRLSHPERSVDRASGLAPARGPRPGSYPRVLSCLRAVEEPRNVAAARRPWKLAAHDSRGACTYSIARRRAADRNARPDPLALRHTARSRPSRTPRPPRCRPAQAHAHHRPNHTSAPNQRLNLNSTKNVVPTFWLSY